MNLREKILRGGAYLVFRQGLGLMIGLIGVLLITRAIGPGNYGLYAAAYGIVIYIGTLAGLGVNVYLVRREAEPDQFVYRQAFTIMFITGLAGLGAGFAAIPVIGLWYQNPAFIPPLVAMLLSLPLTTLTGPAMARLERSLNYRAVSIIELAAMLINYTMAIALAFQGSGVWAPVLGYLAGQLFMLLASCSMSGLVPRPYWSGSLIKEMVGYGAGFSASMWVWQLRTLVNPLLVGRFLGPEAVGCVALAVRLVEALSFVKGVTWRLSIAAFAKLQGDYPRLKRAMEEAMFLQVLSLGPLLAAFALAAPWALVNLFGPQWAAVLLIYPFIALSYLVNAVFSMHSSVLYVLRRNWDVALFHGVHFILFAGGALLLLPRWGLLGYGLAELVALLGYLIIHLQVRRLFSPSYLSVIPWVLAFMPPVWATLINFPGGLLLWLPLVGVLALGGPRKKVLDYLSMIKMRGQ